MNSARQFIDTETIIVNLLKEDKKDYLSLNRLQDLLNYIHAELWRKGRLREYRISFNVNFDAIERTVIYNREIFSLDIDGENILLRNPRSIDDLVARYTLDNYLRKLVQDFVASAA